jgi:YD repeat-containing protein
MATQRKSIMAQIETAVANHYGTSGGFNGIPFDQVRRVVHARPATIDLAVRTLIEAGRLTAVFGDIHPNPAIKALPDEPVALQLAKFSSHLRTSAWLFPTRELLRTQVKPGAYRGRPFTRRLARGEHQFTYDAFDPVILQTYRDDPRYLYHNSDFGGWISVRDEFFESGSMYKRDQVLLRGFGFCFSETRERVVAALLYDLFGLSPQHQQNWNNRRLKGKFKLHPAFWRWVLGEWPNGLSIFGAVLQEIKVINRLSELMGKAPLFRDEFEERPTRFTFLLTPTVEEYDGFVQVLDKIVVENIDEKFFRGDVEPFILHNRKGGVVERERKKSIAMLAEWLVAFYTGSETNEIISTLRKIRRLRNTPSHVVQPNVFKPELPETQRTLMIEVHEAVRLLRMIFHTDPSCRHFKLPRFVDDGSIIWTR